MENKSRKITLAAAGDILLHSNVLLKAKKKTEQGYDFSELLKLSKGLFKSADLTIVNQESIVGGEMIGLSGYPNFNSPIEIGYTLKKYGVDIVNLANDHLLDKGEEGVKQSIENWKRIGMPYVGGYNSKTDKETVRIFNKNGLRVAFVSCTKKESDIKLPKDYIVDYFVNPSVSKIAKRLKQITKANIADVIVLSIHFGKEYHRLPTTEQIEISKRLSDAGANIILGHHSHVLQPPIYIENSLGLQTFCAYSLGNFFSGQYGLYRQIGGCLTIDIEKTKENQTINIVNPKFRLTYVDTSDEGEFKLHLLKDIVNEQKYIKTHEGLFKTEEIYEEIIKHMRKWIPSLEIT